MAAKTQQTQLNDYDPGILWDEVQAGRMTKSEYDELVSNSSVYAWEHSQECYHYRLKMWDLDEQYREGRITPAQYKKAERSFYNELKRNNIPTFREEYRAHFQTDATQKVVVLSGRNAQGQARAKKPTRRAGTKKNTEKSGSSDDGPGDPEPPRQQYFTYASFAQLVDCTTRTLYNKVSTGQFPRPVKTAFGPRFTQQHLDSVILKPAQKGRGRPRIAQSLGKGGAA